MNLALGIFRHKDPDSRILHILVPDCENPDDGDLPKEKWHLHCLPVSNSGSPVFNGLSSQVFKF